MAYDRYESRRGWREPRSRSSQEFGDRPENRSYGRSSWGRDDDERNERGFFERAGDEIASWFGDDEADRRRREDGRYSSSEDDSWRRPRSSMSGDDDYNRYDRQARFRDEGYRRPYTGRFTGRPSSGGDDRFDRGSPPERGWSERWDRSPQREFTGMAATGSAGGQSHDPHYSEWRRRQIDALDRDYDEYRREHQSKFEQDFGTWRQNRQTQRQSLRQVTEHQEVVGSDGQHIGTVDHVRGDRILLTKSDKDSGGHHHSIPCSWITQVSDKVKISKTADEARNVWRDEENRSAFLGEEGRERDEGPHILNRSFSGTY